MADYYFSIMKRKRNSRSPWFQVRIPTPLVERISRLTYPGTVKSVEQQVAYLLMERVGKADTKDRR